MAILRGGERRDLTIYDGGFTVVGLGLAVYSSLLVVAPYFAVRNDRVASLVGS
jgi:hypothetical protein